MKNCGRKDCEQTNPQPVSAFSKNGKGLCSYCRVCTSKLHKKYKKANPEASALKSRKAFLKYFYGITLDQYENMLANQGYSCAICNEHYLAFTKSLHVDHCHKTGMMRELLCPNCNHIIGKAKDDIAILESAVSYLKKHQSPKLGIVRIVRTK